MATSTDARAVARAALFDRIDALGRDLSHLTPTRIAFAVDDIRREARQCRMDAVALLASRLERAMAGSGGAQIVLPYLDAMSDALESDVDSLPPAQQAALFASVGVRLHG